MRTDKYIIHEVKARIVEWYMIMNRGKCVKQIMILFIMDGAQDKGRLVKTGSFTHSYPFC